jgi:hypothetical protein
VKPLVGTHAENMLLKMHPFNTSLNPDRLYTSFVYTCKPYAVNQRVGIVSRIFPTPFGSLTVNQAPLHPHPLLIQAERCPGRCQGTWIKAARVGSEEMGGK